MSRNRFTERFQAFSPARVLDDGSEARALLGTVLADVSVRSVSDVSDGWRLVRRTSALILIERRRIPAFALEPGALLRPENGDEWHVTDAFRTPGRLVLRAERYVIPRCV